MLNLVKSKFTHILFGNVFEKGVKPDATFTALHNLLRPKCKFNDRVTLPDDTIMRSQIEYAQWVTRNIDKFGEGTYFAVSWNKKTGTIVLYPGKGATWANGSKVENTMKIIKKSHLLLEEIILNKPVPLVQRFMISKPYCIRGGGALIQNGVLTPQYISNVLNDRWLQRGQVDENLKNEFHSAITQLQNGGKKIGNDN